MSNKIILKKSSVGAKVPLTSDLDYGELALNYNDFSEEDVSAFLASIEKRNMPKLETLSLKGVSLSSAKYEEAENIVKNK